MSLPGRFTGGVDDMIVNARRNHIRFMHQKRARLLETPG